MELGGWVLEEAGNLQPVLAVAVVSVGGEEELGALGGADGALGGGVQRKAWGRREERSGSRSSACPLSRACCQAWRAEGHGGKRGWDRALRIGGLDAYRKPAAVDLGGFVGGGESDGVERVEALIVGLVSDSEIDVGVGAGDGNNG